MLSFEQKRIFSLYGCELYLVQNENLLIILCWLGQNKAALYAACNLPEFAIKNSCELAAAWQCTKAATLVFHMHSSTAASQHTLAVPLGLVLLYTQHTMRR